jgi:hypothetical protein
MEELRISPRATREEVARSALARDARQLDRLLDSIQGQPTPLAPTGILQQIGGALWALSGLDAAEVAAALKRAKRTGSTLRVVLTGPRHQMLPWELLYHGSAEIGFLGRHPRCALVRRLDDKAVDAPPPQRRLSGSCSSWPLP